jgi:hypothetical protein
MGAMRGDVKTTACPQALPTTARSGRHPARRTGLLIAPALDFAAVECAILGTPNNHEQAAHLLFSDKNNALLLPWRSAGPDARIAPGTPDK